MSNEIALLVAVIVGYVGLGITGMLAAKLLLDRLNQDAKAAQEVWQDISEQLEALHERLYRR